MAAAVQPLPQDLPPAQGSTPVMTVQSSDALPATPSTTTHHPPQQYPPPAAPGAPQYIPPALGWAVGSDADMSQMLGAFPSGSSHPGQASEFVPPKVEQEMDTQSGWVYLAHADGFGGSSEQRWGGQTLQ